MSEAIQTEVRRVPGVGDHLIFTGTDGVPRSATVTGWGTGSLGLYVLRPSGNYYVKMEQSVEDPAGKRSNSWRWPDV